LAAQAAERAAPAPPAALADLALLAETHGLKAGKTGPMSYFELRATPVGKSIDPERRSEFSYLLFRSKDIDAYLPISTQDRAANRFIAMKISDTPGHEPKLAEVRSDVMRAWKLQKAAELAEKFATDEAKKAQAAGSPLGAFFAGGGVVGEVVTTDPFAMYTGGDIAYATTRQLEPYRLSEPAGISAAGRDFMEKVFQLKVGEVAAVMNHDRSIAYVVRLVEHSKPPEELRTDYLAEAGIWPGQQIMTSDRVQRSYQMLTDDILKSYGVEWKRTADQLLEDEEE
jgi:hypothetical protein